MPPLPIAAPSCVLPATVAENAAFLAHKVQEVGLCFFQTEPCLAYTETDVPAELAALPLRYHIHLPVDLPWRKGGAVVARKALCVLEKVTYLKPRYAVLHPPTATPAEQEKLLRTFLKTWCAASKVPILLENLEHAALTDLPESFFATTHTNTAVFGVCLDVGHMLGFGQEYILHAPHLLKAIQLLHWSAPGLRDEHLPLHALTDGQYALVQKLMPLLPKKAVHMLEIFHWDGVEKSWPVLKHLMEA